jgi:hypothetical protein
LVRAGVDLSEANTGTAFFLSTTTVKAVCDADGAGITLDSLK